MSNEPLTYRCPEFMRQAMASIDGDRLWVMCCLVGAANTALLCVGKLTGDQYVASLATVFSVFTGAKALVAATSAAVKGRASAQNSLNTGDFDNGV